MFKVVKTFSKLKKTAKIEKHFVKSTKSVRRNAKISKKCRFFFINSHILFSEFLHVPNLSHFHGQKSRDKSGFVDKSGCDKSEDGQYFFYEQVSESSVISIFYL